MLKNFMDKVYPKILEKGLSIFDISSNVIVGLWSFVLLIGCAYSIWYTKTVTAPVAMIFSTVIGAFAAHKIVKVTQGTDTDTQGGKQNDPTDDQSKS